MPYGSMINPYAIIGVLLGLITTFTTGALIGYRYADNSAEVVAKNTLLSQRDKVISELQSAVERNQAINKQYAEEIAQTGAAVEQLKKVVDDYAEEAANNSCLLDSTAVERLRSIGSSIPAGRPRKDHHP